MAAPSTAVRQYCEQRGFSRLVCAGGFDYLVPRWRRTVDSIAEGYCGLFYEWLDDMDARRIIEELLSVASEAELTQFKAVVPALDARFFELTRLVDACIWGDRIVAKYDYRPDRDWWYYRVPTNLSDVPDRPRWP